MNRKQTLLVVCVVLLLVSSAMVYFFITKHSAATARIGVAVTILPQVEFVEKIGGEKVSVTVMIPQGATLHTYELTPSQMKEVTNAILYAKVGSGVEFELTWLDKIISNNKNMKVVDCSKDIAKIGNDPHIWNSPLNAKIMVKNICDALIEIDPSNADFYRENRDNYLKELDILDYYVRHRLAGFTNRVFMVYHSAFGYFANEYNLTEIAVEQGGKEPTPQVIQDCITKAKQYNLQYVFVTPQFAPGYCETIANEIGGETVFADPLAKNYISNIARITDLLVLEFSS